MTVRTHEGEILDVSHGVFGEVTDGNSMMYLDKALTNKTVGGTEVEPAYAADEPGAGCDGALLGETDQS